MQKITPSIIIKNFHSTPQVFNENIQQLIDSFVPLEDEVSSKSSKVHQILFKYHHESPAQNILLLQDNIALTVSDSSLVKTLYYLMFLVHSTANSLQQEKYQSESLSLYYKFINKLIGGINKICQIIERSTEVAADKHALHEFANDLNAIRPRIENNIEHNFTFHNIENQEMEWSPISARSINQSQNEIFLDCADPRESQEQLHRVNQSQNGRFKDYSISTVFHTPNSGSPHYPGN